MTYFKHPDLPFPASVRREIILAAQEKSKTCELTLALLEMIEDNKFYEDEIKQLEDQLSEIESDYDKTVYKLEQEIEDLEDKLDGVQQAAIR